jgi:Response regulator containing CheY-like receiver and SARP domains
MKVIIVDDEPPLLKEFQKMLEAYDQLEVVGAYTDPLEALNEVEITHPDAAFLDIEMRGLNGIELAENLLNRLPQLDVFFVTAFNHYATEAFETNAVDYILKPVRPERLQKAIDRLSKRKMLPDKQLGDELKIQFFGKFGVYLGDNLIKWSRAKQRELIAYLLLHEGKWIDKYRICDALWRDSTPGQALSHLQTSIWAVRKTIKDLGISNIKIEYQSDSYMLKLENGQWDLKDFNAAADQYKATGNLEAYKRAVTLYGDGCLYNDDWHWAILEQEAYSRSYDKLKRHIKA